MSTQAKYYSSPATMSNGQASPLTLTSDRKLRADVSGSAVTSTEQAPVFSRYSTPVTLATTQDVTVSWANLGSEVDMRGYTKAIIFLTITHTDSVNVRFRVVGKHTSAGDVFVLPILTESASDIKAEDQYVEFNNDETQSMVFIADIDGIPYINVQIQAETVGATADTVTGTLVKLWR